MILDTIEIWVCKWLIKRLQTAYTPYCDEFEIECVNCQAHKAIAFLKENIAILEL